MRLLGAEAPARSSGAEGTTDPTFAAISEAVCQFAEEAAILSEQVALEELDAYVQGVVLSELEDLRSRRETAGARAEAAVQEAAITTQALSTQAGAREDEAEQAEAEIAVRAAERDVTRAETVVAEAEYQQLPLIIRAALKWAWVGVPATAAGVGALVHLALPGLHNQFAKWALIVAAVAAALLTELLIGTLCADLFQRVKGHWRVIAMLVAVSTLLSAIATTEGFATHVRAEAREKQTELKTDAGGNPITSGQTLTPSLVWTFPLSLLLTLGGSGALGLNALREEGELQRLRLKEAKRRQAEAEQRLREQEILPVRHRKEAEDLRVHAGQHTATATAAQTEAQLLIAVIDSERLRHEQFLASLTSKARLRYRIAAAERAEQAGRPTPVAIERGVLAVATVGGAGTAAGAAASLAGASLPLSLCVGAGVVLMAALRRYAGLGRRITKARR
jgi:hypothetical protein